MGCEVLKNYRELEIYRLSYDLAVKVHKLSLTLPRYELYEEGSQLRRAAKGVTSCIVEGYGRKKFKADFVKFLVYAHASCDETILHLNFIRETNEVEEGEIQGVIGAYNELGAKINRYIQYVEKHWNNIAPKLETRNP